MTATVLPSLAAAMAAFCPPVPEPMTTRSYSRVEGCMCISFTAPADVLRAWLIRELGSGAAVRCAARLIVVALGSDWSSGG